MRRFLLAFSLVLSVAAVAAAQGPYTAQIQIALRQFLQTANHWTGTQTIDNLSVTHCTGCGGGGGDLTAPYLIQTADSNLPNAQVMASLATGVVLNTAATGVQTIYAGTSCTNQFPRSLSASAVATCSAVSMSSDVTGTLGAANGGTSVASYSKGDILVATGSTTLINLGVGANGQVIEADSTQTAGLKWATISGTGTVTNTLGALTANQLVIGNGGADVTVLGSLGTANKVLHGNASGAPAFSAVDLTADITNILGSVNGGTGSAFFNISGPSSLRTFTFPDANATVLTTNALVTGAQGGTNNGFFQVSGPASSTKTFTFPNASANVLTDNAAVTFAQGGTGLSSAAAHSTLISSGSAWSASVVANCLDTGGQHINYNQSTDAWSCGTTGSGLAYTGQTTTYSANPGDFVVATSGTFTVTLPAASSNLNASIAVTNGGSGTITIARTGSDKVGNQGETSYTLNPGDAFTWHSDGIGSWYIQ